MREIDFSGVKVKWLGHSSFKFTFRNSILYIDPYDVKGHDKADIILITHGHYDHCSIHDLKKLTKDSTIIVTTPDTTSKLAGKIHTGDMKLVKPGDKLDLFGVKINAVPAYNTNKDFHPKANDWVGYIVEINGIRFYHAGDSDYIPEMAEVTADIIFMPVSGKYVMNAEEAAVATKKIMPKIAIPMHYNKIVGSVSDAEKYKQLCTFCRVELMD